VAQGVRLGENGEPHAHKLAVSSLGTTAAGMCPGQARLPALLMVLPLWLTYTGIRLSTEFHISLSPCSIF